MHELTRFSNKLKEMKHIEWLSRMVGRIGPATLIMIISGIIVLSFLTKKASVTSFTHDESFSYNNYVSERFMDIISNKSGYSNNHVLNTLGMKYSEKAFGSSELALRLPNILLFLVYLFYTTLLMRKMNPIVGISFFLILTTNLFLIDFFGLARGYGMSIGFMTMGIYHLTESFERKKARNLYLFNLACLLAILSSFTMLTFYFAALLVYNLVGFNESHINKQKFELYRRNRENIFSFPAILIILYEPVRKAVKFNSFDFGGKEGFIRDTMSAIVGNSFRGISLSELAVTYLRIVFLVIIAVSFTLIFYKTVRSSSLFFRKNRPLIIVNLIFLGIAAETTLQNELLHTDYLIGRFSLFLVPLFVLNVGFLAEFLVNGRERNLVLAIVIMAAFSSGMNFIHHKNLKDCAEWSYDSETKKAIMAVIADQKNNPVKDHQIKVGINWIFEPTMNFYRNTKALSALTPFNRKGLTEEDDYAYIFMTDTGMLKRKNYQVVFSSDRIKTQLIKYR